MKISSGNHPHSETAGQELAHVLIG